MTTLVDRFKSDIPVITNDFKQFVESIGKVTQDDITNGWVSYAKSIGNTDKELLKFLGTVDSGKANIKDIDTYMQSASTATSKFGAAIKSAAINIGIMLAINEMLVTLLTKRHSIKY